MTKQLIEDSNNPLVQERVWSSIECLL